MMSLIVLTLVFMMMFYCLYMTTFQNHLSSALEQRIRERYITENELYKILYSSGEGGLVFNLKEAIYKAIGNVHGKAIVSADELGSDSGIEGEVTYKNGKLSILLYYPKHLGNDMPSIEVVGNICNPIFLEGNPIVLASNLDEAGSVMLANAYQDLPGIAEAERLNDKNLVTTESGNIQMSLVRKLNTYDYKADLISDGFYKMYLSSDPTICIINLSRNAPSDIINLSMSGNNNTKVLKGIIYIEGDIVIETTTKFFGIIIIKGGNITVKEGATFDFRGKMISDSDVDTTRIKAANAYDVVSQVGIHLPGFYKPVIQYIKVY